MMAKVFHIIAACALAAILIVPAEAQNAAARQPINMPSAAEKSRVAAKPPEPPPAQPAAPVDTPPPTPEQMPPSPPRVAFVDGKLSIVAENSTLGDVLNAVKNLTSADVEYPPSAASERIYAYVGPGSPRDVLTSLLTGSKFDYVILGGANDPNSIESVILSVRAAGSASSDRQPFNPPSRAGFRPSPPPEIPTENVEDDNNPEPEPAPVPPSPPTPGAQVSPGVQPNNPNQPQVKTPEQLLEELRRMQQQQQQQSAPQQPR